MAGSETNRPDFSDYLVHFTKHGDPFGKEDEKDPALALTKGKDAFGRLTSILDNKKIVALTMPWSECRAACFTECPWAGLIAHADQYSSYGIGFHKTSIFARDGGPAFYVRADLYNKQKKAGGWHAEIESFVTPFWPDYCPEKLKPIFNKGQQVDYSHEREWRVPHDFSFEYNEIMFVIVKNAGDLNKISQPLVKSVEQRKFLFLDTYRQIETLWPVHKH